VVVLIDEDYSSMYIDGQVTHLENDPTPAQGDAALILRDSSNDNKSFVDDDGVMKLEGYVYEKGVRQVC